MKNNDLGSILTNPLFMSGISGLNPAEGKNLQNLALEQRAQQQQQMQMQQHEATQQKALRDQQMAEALPQLLRDTDFSNPSQAWQKLTQAGVEPDKAALIVTRIGELSQGPKPEYFRGANGQQHEIMVNPETGMKEAKPIPGQASAPIKPVGSTGNEVGQPRKLTAGEIRLNKVNLDKLNASAKSSTEQLKQLTALEKAYETLDKESTKSTGSGSFISALLPESDQPEGLWKKTKQGIENAAYNDKARSALHTIKKVNSLLLQNRIATQSAGGKQVTDVLKKEIKAGLPNPEVLPEARKENINSLKREAFKNIVEQQFFSTWSKMNGRDTDETGAAFNAFVESFPIVDENGNPKKEVIKLIPQFVREFLSSSGQEQSAPESNQGFEQYNYDFEG